jgi:hypothetical protein
LKRPKLPAVSKPHLEEIRIYGSARAESPEIRTAEEAAKTAEASTDQKIVVAETLENPHPVVRATVQKLKSQRPNEHGCLFCASADIFSVSVSPAQLDRALRILNAIVRASEERGFLVQKGETSAYLEVNSERINFSLCEKIDRIPHEQTPAEAVRAAKERKHSPSLSESRPWWQPQWDYRPSGRLNLELAEHYHTGLRRVFCDGKRQRLENLLHDFIAATVVYSAAQKTRREENDRREREWREREQRRIEQQQQIERNKKRWTFVSDKIQALERAEKIDRFVQHVASTSSEFNPLAENVRRLIDWARRYSGLLKSVCAASELDSGVDKDLFGPPTVETDQWFEIV